MTSMLPFIYRSRDVDIKHPIHPLEIKTKKNSEYPSTFFEKEKRKPILKVDVRQGISAEQTKSYIENKLLSGGELKSNVVIFFLYHFGKKIKGNLSEAWTSFGVTIGDSATQQHY